jgi:subtilase family serine protease
MNALPHGNSAQQPGLTPAQQPGRTLAQQSLHPSAAELGLWPRAGQAERVCADAPAGYAHCLALVRTDIHGLLAPDIPAGYSPADLRTAYDLTKYSSSKGSGETVAVVDAYDDPDAASDLAIYRRAYGLRPCTSANHCYAKKAFTLQGNSSWGEEESVDLDMVSAICPNCKILLVEAANNDIGSLASAEKYATAHADYVSNSWSGDEGSRTYDGDFNVSGVAITAATGDNGYNRTAQWPAILPSVTAVGGTTLSSFKPRIESAWSYAGSGCSTIYAKPSFQHDLDTGCSDRAEADTSADADPNTGVAVYDTDGESGWLVFGGTSVAAPIIASVFALGGNRADNNDTHLYAHKSSLNDVKSGQNGSCGKPLCTAGPGWDGPTGLGTPKGIAAF